MLPRLLLALAMLGQSEPAAQVNGYLGARFGYARGFESDPPPLADLYGTSERALLMEANAQLRLSLREGYEARADLSAFVNTQSAASGRLGSAPAMGNRLEPSELYLNLGFAEHLNGLVGRKRLVWGSGFAFNPSDLLNPAKDPTDPSLQRAGAWMVRLEAPFEKFTATALWAPKVTATEVGLPRRFLTEPGGAEFEQLFGARLYALLAGADLNLIWMWSNRYADVLPHSHRFAASFSRYFFTDYELHAEAIAQQGRDALSYHSECLPGADGNPQSVLACRASGQQAVMRPDAESSSLFARVIAGTRYTFSDDSTVSLEYYFNGAGLSPAQFADRTAFLRKLPDALAAAQRLPPELQAQLPDPSSFAGGDAGQPLRFAFSALRRHYLFLVFQKPKLLDDFSISATALVGLEEPSALVAPSLSYSARDWLTLTASLYLPLGDRDSELGGLPFKVRGLFEARAFY